MTPYEPTQDHRDLVETLAGYGVPQEDIARLCRISVPTLLKHFRDDLDMGVAKANAAVGANVWRMATGNGPEAPAMARYWTKARMGWREVPSEVNVNVNDQREGRSAEDRAKAMALVMARRAAEKADGEHGRPH